MSFNPNDFVTPYITLDEVLEIKKAFDLFDRDLGGAIDPRGKNHFNQNLRLPSTHSELRLRHKLFIR
jgi:Ca2+-binding EF-hand superfamily protein